MSRALDAWDPLQDTIPVHAWLHPWLPWLGPRLEVLYPTIRFRLSRALQAWHPQDGSALALLLPWHKVELNPEIFPPHCIAVHFAQSRDSSSHACWFSCSFQAKSSESATKGFKFCKEKPLTCVSSHIIKGLSNHVGNQEGLCEEASCLASADSAHGCVQVFEEKDWNDLMVRSIIPRLATALDGFLVNPAEQDMTPFYWVTSWAAVIHPVHMVNLLEAHFFPQWHSKLHFWLSHSPDYNEVSNWYLNWKVRTHPIPSSSHPFNQALSSITPQPQS